MILVFLKNIAFESLKKTIFTLRQNIPLGELELWKNNEELQRIFFGWILEKL